MSAWKLLPIFGMFQTNWDCNNVCVFFYLIWTLFVYIRHKVVCDDRANNYIFEHAFNRETPFLCLSKTLNIVQTASGDCPSLVPNLESVERGLSSLGQEIGLGIPYSFSNLLFRQTPAKSI